MDQPRTYYTEWSHKKKDKYHILTYIWNLERQYHRIYLQGSNGETDIENRLTEWEEGGEGEMYRRVTWKLALPYIK